MGYRVVYILGIFGGLVVIVKWLYGMWFWFCVIEELFIILVFEIIFLVL